MGKWIPGRSWRIWGNALVMLLVLVQESAMCQNSEPAKPPPPGKLVDIGGYRLHIYCTGKGDPAVVLIYGAGAYSVDWSLVQPDVARFAQVCSYDRAGDAWSDPGPTPRTLQQEAYELHSLLHQAGVHGPYVLVGASMGGLIARVFADRYLREVAGMVLIDATHENTQVLVPGQNGPRIVHLRELTHAAAVPEVHTMQSSPPKPLTPKEIEEFHKFWGPPTIDPPYERLPPDKQQVRLWAEAQPKRFKYDFMAESLQKMYLDRQKHPCPLGDRPLFVLAAGKHDNGPPPPGYTAEQMTKLWEEKGLQKRDEARLSRNSKYLLVPESDHEIHVYKPEAVISAIHEVVEAVRHHKRLNPSE